MEKYIDLDTSILKDFSDMLETLNEHFQPLCKDLQGIGDTLNPILEYVEENVKPIQDVVGMIEENYLKSVEDNKSMFDSIRKMQQERIDYNERNHSRPLDAIQPRQIILYIDIVDSDLVDE